MTRGHYTAFEDTHLVAAVRTPFTDLQGVMGAVSPTDLGIKVAKEVLSVSGFAPADVDSVIAGSVAQASFDAYLLPRHIGLYAGVPQEVPALHAQRVCGTGFELLKQAAEQIALGQADCVLCVGTESMTRNPIAAYTHRDGFGLGASVAFKDFLWEALMDPAPNLSMIQTAETLAQRYAITREQVDAYAERSFSLAVEAQAQGALSAEIIAVENETFSLPGYSDRRIRLPHNITSVNQDTHIRPSPRQVLSQLSPVYAGGLQTAGNSAAVVDGAAAALVMAGPHAARSSLARLCATAVVGVAPEIMGIGPAPAIRLLLEHNGLTLNDIDRIEINEAQGAQVLAVARELDIDLTKLNVQGGAIAIGHPLAATGLRLAMTLAQQLKRDGLRYGIAAVCIGGGQGMAILLEHSTV
ncbi:MULTISPECIES: thiolase family protein [unclassified Halomonas]|uniref:thiolase family protein n=1 Tax=unclassified Halomonas TaxID=2609666 RepID=UPI001EF7382E|nr:MULTISPECIES: thiolase family protein [unclassified Halomonas]MCG7576294.1 thiolase family protein [Halomonas sp. MMH1-48]MCG7603357.1 thiolase family protein [Halomonas sp. MM17-34]MCG7612607.1 thiolase family protein [Halomonas sp. MM17-29]MCG7619827.1 thiolase family protein [Halomonas sp. DSH1-27]